MTPPQTLQLNEITVENRFRKDLGSLEGLKASMQRIGLVQPIIVDRHKRLVAGGRRYAAATELGWDRIAVSYREVATPADHFEAELEENKHRKDFSWQEECFLIERIHLERRQQAGLEGKKWGQDATGSLFGITTFSVSYALRLAEEVKAAPDAAWSKASTAAEAWKLIMIREQDAARSELARRHAEAASNVSDFIDDFEPIPQSTVEVSFGTVAPPDHSDGHLIALRERGRGVGYLSLNENEARSLYLSNTLNKPEEFETYHAERIQYIKNRDRTIHLSRCIHNINCIEFMNDAKNANRFAHIITDIPYAIDIDMIDQENTGSDASAVAKEHDVDDNLKLFEEFFPAAFRCTQEKAFIITFCDAMHFRLMHDLAVKAGFMVQRWPFHWIKTQANNQAPTYNQTKIVEHAIICRKETTTRQVNTGYNYIEAGKDDLCEKIDHLFAKPFAVWERLVTEVSHEGQLILEPFAGRGSGVLSMLQLKRSVVACELNTAHYNALLHNVKQHYLSIDLDYLFL